MKNTILKISIQGILDNKEIIKKGNILNTMIDIIQHRTDITITDIKLNKDYTKIKLIGQYTNTFLIPDPKVLITIEQMPRQEDIKTVYVLYTYEQNIYRPSERVEFPYDTYTTYEEAETDARLHNWGPDDYFINEEYKYMR